MLENNQEIPLFMSNKNARPVCLVVYDRDCAQSPQPLGPKLNVRRRARARSLSLSLPPSLPPSLPLPLPLRVLELVSDGDLCLCLSVCLQSISFSVGPRIFFGGELHLKSSLISFKLFVFETKSARTLGQLSNTRSVT
jgi:hypothetical protein